MTKKVIVTAAVLLILAMATSMAFAADDGTTQSPQTPPSFKSNLPQLTDEQLQELKALHEQMLNLRKQMIKKYVEFGYISQEQADAMLQRLDEMAKWRSENGYYGPGFGHGRRGGFRGGFHGGFRGGFRGNSETRTPETATPTT